MQKLLDARPMITMYFGVLLVLVSSLVLWNKNTDAIVGLFTAIKHQHLARGLAFELGDYAGRCASDLNCITAYLTVGWQESSPLERSAVVSLGLGLMFTLIGRYWNPALQSSNKTQATGMDQNALPAQSAGKPGSWLPWA